nr:hypothetical protein [uncultured Desulfobulbus sp.]
MNSLSILVADDSPVIRRLFEKRLSDEGYKVTVAVDGTEAARFLAIPDITGHNRFGYAR